MHTYWFVTFTLLLLFPVLISCRWWSYTGDGYFKDSTCISPEPRFALKLGAVDLSLSHTYTYTMKGLPKDRFGIGFRIVGPTFEPQTPHNPSHHIGETKPINPKLRLSLSNKQGQTVINMTGALRHDWVWSYTQGIPEEAFIYGIGEEKKIQTGNQTFTYRHIGVLADEGWGTSFTPRSSGEYYLVLEVIEGDPDAKNYQIELEATGGGYALL